MARYVSAAALMTYAAFTCQSALAADYQTPGLTAADNALPVFYEALRTKMNFTLGWKDGADPRLGVLLALPRRAI